MFQTFIYEMTVLERHLDTFQHMNNARYAEVFEEARWDFITKNGYGWSEVQKNKQGPVILGMNLKFKRELRLREKVRIESKVTTYNKKIGILSQTMFNSKNEIACEGEYTMGYFDFATRKLIMPTEQWLKAIGVS